MKKLIKNIIFRVGGFLVDNFEMFTKPIVICLFVIGLFCAILAHYLEMGFNWKWFCFFELPLYLFCTWAIYKVYKMITNNIN